MILSLLILQTPVQKVFFERYARVEKALKELNSRYNQPEFYIGRFKGRSAPAPDTLTVCVIALRVEFQKEIPDDSLTTGDGTFDLSTHGKPGTFDYKPPYDSLYFVSMMEFSRRYYEDITYGRIRFSYLVLPVVQVPHPIRYYGDLNFFGQGITSFFRDAIRAVDEQTSIVFRDLINDCPNSTGLVFPRILIFFAGGAYQTDRNGDSPYDLPAVTLYSGALDYYLGQPFIVANEGRDTIYDATLMPMAMTQDSFVVGLQGTLIHELNHLIFFTNDVYDYNFLGTGAGYYDLMATGGYGGDVKVNYPDTTLYIYEGFLPTRPGAYTLLYMDSIINLICPTCQRIVEPSEVVDVYARDYRDAVSLNIQPSTFQPHFYRVWLDPDEYYLVEFRKREYVEDSLVNFIWNSDSTLLYGIYDREWDFALPGEGLLVWHIDGNIIDSAGWAHQSARPMGVDLMEADGAQDFEYYLGNFDAWWKGTPYDPYRADNRSRIDESTFPSTLSNEKGITGWRISGISSVSSTMSFSISNGIQMGYFHPFGQEFHFSRAMITPHDVNGDGVEEAVVLLDMHVDTVNPENLDVVIRSMLVVLDTSGNPLYPERYFTRNESYFWYDYTFHYPPLVHDFDGDGNPEVYLASVDGKIHAFEMGATMSPMPGYPYSMDYPLRGCLSRVGNYILLGRDDGSLILFDPVARSVINSYNTFTPATSCPEIVGDTIYYQSPDGILYVLDGSLNLLARIEMESLPQPLDIKPIFLNGKIYAATENYLWIIDGSNFDILRKSPLRDVPEEISFYRKGILISTSSRLFQYGFDGSFEGKVADEGIFPVSFSDEFLVNNYRFDYSRGFGDVYPALLSLGGDGYAYAFADVKGNVYIYRLGNGEPVVRSYREHVLDVESNANIALKPYVYPNPVEPRKTPIVRFGGEAGKSYRILVLDFSGRKVFETSHYASVDGVQEVPLGGSFSRGVYYVVVEGKGRARFFVKGR